MANFSGSLVDDPNPMGGNIQAVPHVGIQGPRGPQGPEGGHYIPHIEQTGDNELTFEFSPSSPDMPAVDPVHVVLPVAPDSGGNVDYVGAEPAEDDIPKVFITGVKPTTKDDVLAEMEYVSKTDKFHAYLTIKCQGNSSMSYAKKNFTVKMFSDESRETKLKKDFKDWNHPGNKFVLKANYIDHSHARNIVSARLWGEVVASRPDYDSLPVEMRNAPNNGAIDGFPIKVYYNGKYEGVYTWNIGKDDWMWGMDEDNPNHVLMCAETNDNGAKIKTPCNFRALWNGVNESSWSVEVGTNSTALKNSLNNLIQFVMDNDGDDFRNGIGNYLDVQSAIDYYIFMYDICGLDNLARNMLLATYDGVKWICGAYDLDSTFGMWWDGTKFVAATYACPEDYQETNSLLWERIESNFLPELKARQAELRKTVLSYPNMVTHFERFMDNIGLDLYAEDLTIYGIPSGSTNNIKQIRNYIRDRQAYVDAEFAAMTGEPTEPEEPDNPEPSEVPCTGITLDKTELTFDGEGTQTITATVTPSDTTDSVAWSVSPVGIATVSGGVVTAVENGSCTVTATCGEQSATCAVSVSGIGEQGGEEDVGIDYALNALDGATWISGTFASASGAVSASTTDIVTESKSALQSGVLYAVTNESNATWPALAWFKPDGTHIYSIGANGTGSFPQMFCVGDGVNILARACVDGIENVDMTKLVVKPKDNRATATQYAKINFADCEWYLTSNGYCECVTSFSRIPTIDRATLHNVDLFVTNHGTGKEKNSGTIAGFTEWVGTVYLGVFSVTNLDSWNAYIAEYNPYIEINPHLKPTE